MSQQLAFQDEASDYLGIKDFGTDGPSECVQPAQHKVGPRASETRPPCSGRPSEPKRRGASPRRANAEERLRRPFRARPRWPIPAAPRLHRYEKLSRLPRVKGIKRYNLLDAPITSFKRPPVDSLSEARHAPHKRCVGTAWARHGHGDGTAWALRGHHCVYALHVACALHHRIHTQPIHCQLLVHCTRTAGAHDAA